MLDLQSARAQLHTDLGYKPLDKLWAKLEILVGLSANGIGVMVLLYWVVVERGLFTTLTLPTGGLALFVLGGYLTLAGHRSHLYQSSNDRTAYLLEQLRQLTKKG